MATVSDISICSSALIMVGAEEITSFNQSTREAKICGALYENLVLDMIQGHPWRFSLAMASLTLLQATPLFNYDYAFALPSGCLSVISDENGAPYEVFENKLYTSESTIKVTYQMRPLEARWPKYFVRVCELELATVLSTSLSGDESKMQLFQALAAERLKRARFLDSKQQPNRAMRQSNFLLNQARL